MSHHSPPLHPYTPSGGQTLHCARALHGILRSGGQPSQFSALVHPSTPSGGQTHIHTCLPVREAHLSALSSASLPLKPVLELFFCSDAYVRPSGCASPYSVEYRFSAPPAISIAIPSPVERESPSCRVSARSTVTELTPLSGKSRFQDPLPAQRYSKPPR